MYKPLNSLDNACSAFYIAWETSALFSVHADNVKWNIQNEYKRNKTKSNAVCGNREERVKIVINGNPVEQVSDFKYLRYFTSDYTSDLVDKLQTY